jgi:hypothetical protein
MKEQTVTWKKDRGAFLGRNGLFKCRGLHVTSNDHDLFLEPVTSQGLIGRCLISIPKDQVKNLIKTIKETMK